jgi:hypothetical protein
VTARRDTGATTLVVSDLHLGMRSGHDLVRREAVRARLLERLDGVDRVVLLGDTLELRQGPMSTALAVARPFFEALGEVLGDREVVLVPGNHDHRLLAAWHDRRRAGGEALALAQQIAPRDGEPAGMLAGWLRPAGLTLAYPGVWLRDDVYATHGHYLDRHTTLPTIERLVLGAMSWLVGPPLARSAPDDYEAGLAPLYALVHELAQARRPHRGSHEHLVRRLLKPGAGDRPPRISTLGAALPLAIAALNTVGLGPLRSDMAVADLWRAGVRAMGDVCVHLALDAPFVLFGHLHRAGPRRGDDTAAWIAPTGTRLINTGSWVDDPRLRGSEGADGYRPGTCVLLDGASEPVVEEVLDGWTVTARRPVTSGVVEP